MRKNVWLSLWILLILILSSCSAVQKATIEADANAKTLAPPIDKALVYVVRPSFLGTLIRFNVEVDDTFIGATGGQRFLFTYQEPGVHRMTSKAENTAVLELDLAAGQIYYVEQVPRMGIMMARNKLKLLDTESGRNKLSKCKLSADNSAGQNP